MYSRQGYHLRQIVQISFVDEDAIDTGGPRREYWRLLSENVQAQYCKGQKGKVVFEKIPQQFRYIS